MSEGTIKKKTDRGFGFLTPFGMVTCSSISRSSKKVVSTTFARTAGLIQRRSRTEWGSGGECPRDLIRQDETSPECPFLFIWPAFRVSQTARRPQPPGEAVADTREPPRPRLFIDRLLRPFEFLQTFDGKWSASHPLHANRLNRLVALAAPYADAGDCETLVDMARSSLR